MTINKMNDFRNNLLNRREITTVFKSESNPGIIKVANSIAEQFKVDVSLIVVKNLRSNFGQNSFLIEAFVYDSLKDKERIEQKKKKKNVKGEEVKK